MDSASTGVQTQAFCGPRLGHRIDPIEPIIGLYSDRVTLVDISTCDDLQCYFTHNPSSINSTPFSFVIFTRDILLVASCVFHFLEGRHFQLHQLVYHG